VFDDLPGLVVLLLDAVARLREIENYGDEHAETAEVFKGFEKRPVAET